MERSKSELSVSTKRPLTSSMKKAQGTVNSKEHHAQTSSVLPTNGLNLSSSMSNLTANASLNSTNGSSKEISQNPKRKSRFGSLYHSLLTSDSSEGTLSPNAVRGIMNPYRSRLGLPPLEVARLSKSPELESENTTDSPAALAALTLSESEAASTSSSNITPPTPGESTGDLISPEILPSPEIDAPLSRVTPHIIQKVPKAPIVPRSVPEDQNMPPRMPIVAAVVPPPHLNPIHKTPVTSKTFCPPPAPRPVPLSGSAMKSQKGNVTNRSAKKPSSGWRFPTEFVSDREYLIMKEIGKGGCGEVSLAMEKETRGLFALKKINLAGLDQTGIDECVNEIKLLVELRDTNLVIHIESWEMNPRDRTIKIVMEYGQCDLNKSISSDKTSSLNKVKSVWERMLQIVQTIHQRGIVHADLKPANFVWVGGNLKIIDFGIANKLQPDFTSIATCNPKGTLNFISPETVNQDMYGRTKISPRSDIWSLGCILYLMVYGRTPFQNITHQMAKIHAIINGITSYPPLPAQFEGSSVISVLQLCFQTDPKLRPTATQLLEHQFLQNP